MKLELKYLAPYLPYDLKIMVFGQTKHEDYTTSMKSLHVNGEKSEIGFALEYNSITGNEGYFKPILKPLSDLNKQDELDICEYSDIERVVFSGNPSNLYFVNTEEKTYLDDYVDTLGYLFENHFDVFGLIEKGLAVDINTLKN